MRRLITVILAIILALISVHAVSAESATAKLQEMYSEAELLMATGDYSSAAVKFEAMGAYSDASKMAMYCKAVSAAEDLNLYEVAAATFDQLGDFRDSKQLAQYYIARAYQWGAEQILSEQGKASANDLSKAAAAFTEAKKIYTTLALFKDCLMRIKTIEEEEKNCNSFLKSRVRLGTMTFEGYFSDKKENVDKFPRKIENANDTYTNVYSYDMNLNLVKIEKKSSMPTVEKIQRDQDGKIVSAEVSGQWSSDKNKTYESIKTYDEHENCIKEIRTIHSPKNEIKKDGKVETYTHEYEYDQAGNMTRDIYYYDNKLDSDTEYKYSFDDYGRISSYKQIKHTSKNKYVRIYTLQYDSNGLLVKKVGEPENSTGLWYYEFFEYKYADVR